MKLGNRIKQLRENKRLKQLDIANALRVSPQAVSKWERDENHPDIVTLVKLARMMEVTTDQILGVNVEDTEGFKASVFSSSINDFAVRSSNMDVKEVADWANAAFYHLTESVLKYDGVPVKYVGDGFLCFFAGLGHAERALKAAINAKKIIQNSSLVIAVNTGDIYLGTIGHPDYSSKDIYGDAVNRAFLINEAISGSIKRGIALSKSAKSEIKGEYNFKKHGKLTIGRLNEKMDIYEVSGSWT